MNDQVSPQKMIKHQAWLNGQPCDQSLCFDRGLFYGDGFFTTILCHNQQLLNWSAHWQRLQTSAARLAMPALDQSRVLGLLEPALAAMPSNAFAVLKLVVTRAASGQGYTPAYDLTEADLRFLTYLLAPPAGLLIPIESTLNQQALSGLTAIVCQTPVSVNPSLAGIKHLNRLDNVLARREVALAQADEGVMLDSRQQVVCATQGNLVALYQDQGLALTPKLDQAGVAGTCLAQLQRLELELANKPLRWQEQNLNLDTLLKADAVFVCNAVRGVQALARLEQVEYDTRLVQPINQAWWSWLLSDNGRL